MSVDVAHADIPLLIGLNTFDKKEIGVDNLKAMHLVLKLIEIRQYL